MGLCMYICSNCGKEIIMRGNAKPYEFNKEGKVVCLECYKNET